ncbi:hypothetical protein B0H21DRAFT_780615 [Amylocystis lapponica]|nr:hypothetical protein B0H21DRAFT_780615 [Amylocystis lapponica]
MSRRQSRVSIDVRQNDTLLEFENYPCAYSQEEIPPCEQAYHQVRSLQTVVLQLNSTLSVRIEELNAQISTLYVENLRLPQQEREKSRKIIADAEAATHSLMKHLGHIRKSFNPRSPARALPRAKRPVINPDASPPYTRLARAPTVPGITEDDEEHASSPGSPDAADAEEDDTSPPAQHPEEAPHKAAHVRPVAPTRARPAEPAPPPIRKPTRRQSGLLSSVSITTVTPGGVSTELVPPRPPSPAFGSPLRRSVGLEEQEEEQAAARGDLEEQTVVRGDLEEQEVEAILQAAAKRERKEKKRERERDGGTDSVRVREREERRRAREQEEPRAAEGGKSRLKDVTNSHSPPEAASDRERQCTPEAGEAAASGSTQAGPSGHSTRTFLSTPTPNSHLAPQTNYLPTPRSSSPLLSAPASEPEAGGRERRVRKSVNYAEPKLNTKMRKPDPTPSSSKRASMSSTDRVSPEIVPPPVAPEDAPPVAGVKRKKSRVYVTVEDGEESEGTQADAEYGGRASGWANVEGRRRSVTSTGVRRFEDDVRRHSMAV